MRDGERQHRPGFDLTLSCPKSVSIEGLIFHNESAIEAHRPAVKSTLDYIEREFIRIRVTDSKNKTYHYEPTGQMLAATFQHDTSRNLDPHLHTHCVIANADD